MKKLLLISIILFTTNLTKSADYTGLRMGIKIPYSYNFGYYMRLTDRWGAYGGPELVTFPFGSAPVGFLKIWSGNDALPEILKEPFSIGAGFEVGTHYYFSPDNRRYYFGANLQWINLLKRDITDDVIEKAYGVELDDYPIGPILENLSKKPLTLNTHYLNFGGVFGVRFLMPYVPQWEMALEFEVSKTLASHHFLFSDYRYITPVEELNSAELKKLMRRYGWFPSLNIFFIYKID